MYSSSCLKNAYAYGKDKYFAGGNLCLWAAGDTAMQQQVCNPGDSGGALLLEDRNGNLVLAALVSKGGPNWSRDATCEASVAHDALTYVFEKRIRGGLKTKVYDSR
jgi:hypothetical protein